FLVETQVQPRTATLGKYLRTSPVVEFAIQLSVHRTLELKAERNKQKRGSSSGSFRQSISQATTVWVRFFELLSSYPTPFGHEWFPDAGQLPIGRIIGKVNLAGQLSGLAQDIAGVGLLLCLTGQLAGGFYLLGT